MQTRTLIFACLTLTALSATTAFAACEGSNGRGWASGKGNGSFEMAAADKSCLIGFVGFGDSNSGRTIAKEVKLTTSPKSGKLGVSAQGVVYTPNPGFKGKDKFCTRNTTPEMPGKSLSGCVTVTVR